MNSHAIDNQLLLNPFNGREAIYIEKGAVRVRVFNIRVSETYVAADVEELPTPGLRFEPTIELLMGGHPLRWRIGTSLLTNPFFSSRQWIAGACICWSLYFDPEIISGVVKLAALFPPNLQPWDCYERILEFVEDKDNVVEDQRLRLFLG